MARVVRRLLRVVLGVGLAIVLVGLGVNLALMSRLDRIDGAFDGLAGRPPPAAGQTILMIGTRPRGPDADVPWLTGEQSVEAVMLIEIPPDGMSAEVETLPTSSGIRPVLATSSPSASVAAVESWSSRRVDHLIAIDWTTFERLADLNGVGVAYAYGSGAATQHDFLQHVMEGALHQELRKRPLDLYRALSITVDGTAVDDGWSPLEMDLLVLSLRNLRSYAIAYATALPG